ncbi:carboxy terminal-processing peptidase [Marinicella gelatinilytica]|uniref:carboxy terminal-processing peptidase n=1 Tax=Marinicella gelatinilytica TaxID=2996017 RepID=UPI002260E662|nr:carboxy terminal-processing peptidase [Marinicella gelatinilytica]MCX7545683.1 carboxy terminal-processing peptidase [Marinicella gelatinilytica]
MIKPTYTRLLLTLLLTTWLVSASALVADKPLNPEIKHEQESRLLVTLVDELHYQSKELNDELSGKILDEYIAVLDPNKMYFLSTDIVNFDRWRNQMDDFIKAGDLKPAFEIFNLFKKRVETRKNHSLSLLESTFDFSEDESYQWDRKKAEWAMTEKELDEIWRKKVKNDYLSLQLLDKETDDIKKTLTKRYKVMAKRVNDLKSDDVFQYFINAYLSLVEPHTGYMSPITSENFDMNMSLSLEGIGAVLMNDGEYTQINTIVKGGPADLEGTLKKGDKILAVGQGSEGTFEDVVGWGIEDVVQLIRGEKGSTVRMRVIGEDDGPDTPPTIIRIVRDKVKLEQQAAQYKILEIKEGGAQHKIGVIDLPTFYLDFAALRAGDSDYRSTTKDVKKILETFKKEEVQGVVVDLRNNGGGSLYEAINLSGLFIERGPVVQTKTYSGKKDVKKDVDPRIEWEGPMMVMVNRFSASASEIFAAAMQDYGRAVVVGNQTYGKGTIQNVMKLADYIEDNEEELGQLKMTMGQFFRINGGSTQNRGVIPDIEFPASPGSDKYGESEYENALPWSSIAPSDYNLYADLSDEIVYLKQRFNERSKVNFEFDFLEKENQLYQAEKDDLTVSLSAETRQQKVKEREQRKEARKVKRKAMLEATEPNPLLGEITVLVDSAEDLIVDAEKESSDKATQKIAEKDAQLIDSPNDKEEVETLQEETDEEDEDELYVDFRLHESARILSDLIDFNQRRLVAKHDKNNDEEN